MTAVCCDDIPNFANAGIHANRGVESLRPFWSVLSVIWVYAFNWGERVLILGGDGRCGQVTPPAWSSTRRR